MIELVIDPGLNLKELTAYLKPAGKTACKLAAADSLPGFRAGGSWRFRKEAINQWIEEQQNTNKG